MLQIIIRNKQRPSYKGRNISEFARNLESEGWPSEFANEGVRDRIAYTERREGRPLTKQDAMKISKEIKGDS